MRLFGYALIALGVMTAIVAGPELESAPSEAGELSNLDLLRAAGAI